MAHGTSRRWHPQGGVSTLLMLLAATFTTPASEAASSPMHFDIPAGDAIKTLPQFLQQSNIEMLYSTDVIRGVRTRAIYGDMTVEQALHQMLADSGLEIEFENDYQYAQLRKIDRHENETGSAEIQSAPISAAVNMRDVARGLPETPPKELSSETDLKEVVVTGTLLHGVLDVMSPLEIIGREQMKRSTYATVQNALQALTFSSNAGPSEDLGGLGNFARGSSVNLRGLGSGATLVLVDGQRQPYSGTQGDFTDISTIPWSAIERIEILPDGSSALYGSDAIAGAVNVILRKDFVGAETWARLGSARGGSDEKLVAQLLGSKWRRGRAMIGYQYSERGALRSVDRDYAADSDKRTFGGTDLRAWNSVPGNIIDPRTLQPAYGISVEQMGLLQGADGLWSSNINLLNRNAVKDLLPEKRAHSFFLNGSQSVGDRSELWAEARFSDTQIDFQNPAFEQVLMVPATNPYIRNPYPEFPFVLVGYSFLNDLGPVRGHGEVRTSSGTLGLKRSLGDTWRLRLTGTYGRESMLTVQRNVPDQDALQAALESADLATAFNAFGDGYNNAAVIEKIRSRQRDQAASEIASGTFIADGTVVALPTGEAKLAVGSEIRKESFGNTPGGDLPFARRVESAFAELSVPIVGRLGQPRATPRLEISLAGRYERYDDFGSTWNPKIGLRWAPWDFFKVRTSWGTSFKAPKLTDLHDTLHNTSALSLLKDPRSETGSSAVLFSFGNNPDLKEETASTWTAGLDIVLPSMPRSTLSLTYYAIDYTNRIITPGIPRPSDILLQEEQWRSVINRNPSPADIEAICSGPFFVGSLEQCRNTPVAAIVNYHYRNLSSTRVSGLDLNFDQNLDTKYGAFRLGLAGSYLFSFEQAATDSSPRVSLMDTVSNPISLRLRGIAEWYQHRWDLPGFGVNLAVDHMGGYNDIDVGEVRNVGAFTSVDLRLSYRTSELEGPFGSVEISLNAANLFDRAPPFVNREDGYDASNMEPYGRVVSFAIQKTW